MKPRLRWVRRNQGNIVDAHVNFDPDIQVAQREEEPYAATIKPLHVTGYSYTPDGAIDRARQGLDRLLEAYEEDGTLMQFPDENGIEYTHTQN